MENYSVLMTVYKNDNPEFFDSALESMFNQTVQTDDFILVEDGLLSEELYKVVTKYKKKHPELNVVSYSENHGLAYALNIGLKKSKNRLVARMDSDDISAPNRCEEQLKEFERTKDLVVLGTSMTEFENELRNVKSVKKMPCSIDSIRKYARRRSPFNHPSVMYDKNIVLSEGGYNEKNLRAEDFELFSSIVFKGYNCKNLSEFLLFYRTDSSQIKRRFNWQSCKSIIMTQFCNYKRRYVNIFDFLFVFCAQIFGLLCPKVILRKLFLKSFRNKDVA